MAIAWNHIQLELVDRLGDEGLALARQLAMTTYRSEIDFDGRFGRAREPDGRFSINSYLDHQGDKLVDRFDRDTYRTLVRVMDGHDVGRWPGRDRGRVRGARGRRRRPHRPGHPGRHPLRPGAGPGRWSPRPARPASDARYRELHSTKGHDAFLIEWDQLTRILGDVAELDELRQPLGGHEERPGPGDADRVRARRRQVAPDRGAGRAHRRPGSLRVWYHCSPNLQSSPLAPVIRQFAIAAGFAEHDDDATRLRKLETLIPKLAMDAPGIVSLLANLLSVRIEGEYAPVNMSPQRQKRRLFQVLMQSLEAFAARRTFPARGRGSPLDRPDVR